MGKLWVLDTSTKGTGANMVPLERVLRQPSPSAEPLFVPKPRQPPPPEEPKPREPRTFKVVDLMSRQVLADGASTRETIDVLKGVRSVVDVNVYVWQPEHERWRLLTFSESAEMWKLRDR
jgi:hypothetical protein